VLEPLEQVSQEFAMTSVRRPSSPAPQHTRRAEQDKPAPKPATTPAQSSAPRPAATPARPSAPQAQAENKPNLLQRASNSFNNLMTESYQDAKALQQSSNPAMRAVGNYSVAVRDTVSNVNKTVDESIQYWQGVNNPAGRVMGTLAGMGKGFTAPLRAVDHNGTNESRNQALIETGIQLVTAGATKVAGPAMQALAKTPVGQAVTRYADDVARSPLGQAAMAKMTQVGSAASWLNQAPSRLLGKSSVGQALLGAETRTRAVAQAINNFQFGRAGSDVSQLARGINQLGTPRTPAPAAAEVRPRFPFQNNPDVGPETGFAFGSRKENGALWSGKGQPRAAATGNHLGSTPAQAQAEAWTANNGDWMTVNRPRWAAVSRDFVRNSDSLTYYTGTPRGQINTNSIGWTDELPTALYEGKPITFVFEPDPGPAYYDFSKPMQTTYSPTNVFPNQ
jgi:hypothetical protein